MKLIGLISIVFFLSLGFWATPGLSGEGDGLWEDVDISSDSFMVKLKVERSQAQIRVEDLEADKELKFELNDRGELIRLWECYDVACEDTVLLADQTSRMGFFGRDLSRTKEQLAQIGFGKNPKSREVRLVSMDSAEPKKVRTLLNNLEVVINLEEYYRNVPSLTKGMTPHGRFEHRIRKIRFPGSVVTFAYESDYKGDSDAVIGFYVDSEN